ncbi:MAG TPA: Hsp20/alpha crystallin family protein [Methanoregulaceae archaeon]|nr:MAG: Hsp20/alpha crystallin family protein [Methanolinea sp.]HON81922.1 Hsp20/alpha crystallin family protein [Methanoregulaceae archaeon]HPD10680.1 Hsp20/alpha crystallin family protein [Methanoregulaceae archaeon]HRT15809.1 Hsp20/alpha crystallin family protein [Methanoregulaceae archaeon]HRU31323.1 Hsp20/alpha crystallin family protein [Methanoregulaceae archaeon]
MVYRRRYPFWWTWRDFDELMTEMENRFWGPSGRLLPAGGIADRMLPALRGEFRVDVREHDDEIIVVADLPGVEKEDVTVTLVNPSTLEISSERKAEKEEKEEGYYMRERVSGSLCRTVALPHDVTDSGATASFKNGVLEVRLKKIEIRRGSSIKVD